MTQRHWIQNDQLMLITTVTRNRFPFFEDPSHAREAVECLYRVRALHPFQLYGFVIMPDHVHLLLFVPSPRTMSNVMCSYKAGLTFDIGIQPLWQRRYHQKIVTSASVVLQYIHLNPVRAGLCEMPRDYPWSSASGLWEVDEFN